MGYFGVGVGFENCFGVYSCSWTTLIFYVFLNSDFWFWPTYFLGSFWLFVALRDYFWDQGLKSFFEQILFSMFSSILKFNFDTILGVILALLGRGKIKIWFGSTHIVEQLSFSMFFSFLTFDFDLIFGSFFTFWGPNGLFLGLE